MENQHQREGDHPEKPTQKPKEGTGIGGSDISGEDSAQPEIKRISKSFDRDQIAIDLGLNDGDLDNDIDRRNNELI